MSGFEQIAEARKLLGLSTSATLQEIKESYRRLAVKYHPDKCREENKVECDEMMSKLNEAYELIMGYCAKYRYSFEEKDVARTYPYDDYLRRYRHAWFDGP